MPYKWKDRKKEYQKEYHAKWYQKNKEKVQKASQEAKARKLAWYRELKSQYSCERCGFSHPAAIDFHHRNPNEKDFCIGNSQGMSKEKILAELDKCIALCSNCHRIEHWDG
jgi:hypothetical protein